MKEPCRQIHLDFHTSRHIEGIGSRFSKKQFQDALQLGRVELINVFAKCHHGWSYYPTKVGNPHPHLECDLLGGQIEACHEIGVKAPIYYTMGWSVYDAETHPEWCMRDENGELIMFRGDLNAEPDEPRPICSWINLCPTGGYHEMMCAQVDEICQMYPADGLWFDIYLPTALCYCDNCRRDMKERGLDVNNRDDVLKNRAMALRQHTVDMHKIIHGHHPDASIYFNGFTHIHKPSSPVARLFEMNTKNDLEDLPTTWGGYDKLPMRAKFFHKANKPVVAMSGKFHTSWGEFGGFKHPDAIRYEAASMIAFGACANFGDQLHPAGEMDMSTYANVGEAFAYAEQIEQYGVGGKPAASLAVWPCGSAQHDEGVSRMLLEEQTDFDVVVDGDKLTDYELIVIPSATELSPEQAESLNRYAKDGGKLLVLGSGALDASRQQFILDVGADYLEPGSYDVDYTVVGDAAANELVRSPFLNYAAGLKVMPHADADILATIREPYFSRTYGKYCSHQNTPYQLEDAAHPAMLRKGNVIFTAHELDEMYQVHGARVHRQLFTNALALLGHKPMVTTELPSAGRISLLHQPDQKRYVAHLLYAPAMPRGRATVIEDLVPLYSVPVSIRLSEKIKNATLIPDGTNLPMSIDGDMLKVEIPEFTCHCAVVFGY